jgi:hypothetical protein
MSCFGKEDTAVILSRFLNPALASLISWGCNSAWGFLDARAAKGMGPHMRADRQCVRTVTLDFPNTLPRHSFKPRPWRCMPLLLFVVQRRVSARRSAAQLADEYAGAAGMAVSKEAIVACNTKMKEDKKLWTM